MRPYLGEIIHVGPTCQVGIVLEANDTEIYVRVIQPKTITAPGVRWGGIMVVTTSDMEGWIAQTEWHWPEYWQRKVTVERK